MPFHLHDFGVPNIPNSAYLATQLIKQEWFELLFNKAVVASLYA